MWLDSGKNNMFSERAGAEIYPSRKCKKLATPATLVQGLSEPQEDSELSMCTIRNVLADFAVFD